MVEIDTMAKRYGCQPSTFLHNDPWEFTFNLLAAQLGTQHEADETRRRQKELTRGRLLAP